MALIRMHGAQPSFPRKIERFASQADCRIINEPPVAATKKKVPVACVKCMRPH